MATKATATKKKTASKNNGVFEEIARLVEATKAGQLQTRANVDQFDGQDRVMLQGVNDLIDAFVRPINVTSEYVDRISKGDMPPQIADAYSGDFNKIKNNLNALIATLNNRSQDVGTLIQCATQGELDYRADTSKYTGFHKTALDEVNGVIEALVKPLKVTALYVEQISKGAIPAKITDNYSGDFNEIKNNLNNCIDVMSGLLTETDTLIKATQDGKLQTRGNASAFAGDWGKLVGGVNNLIEAFVRPINVTAEYVDQISKGNIPAKITDEYKGDFNEIKGNLNNCIDVMNGLLSETDMLIKATQDGKLQTRSDADAFPGGWGKLVGGVNNLIEAFVRPINVTAEYVDQISKGNIPAKITDTYNGDFNEIKKNLNNCIDVMNGLLTETDTLIKATQDGKLQTRGNADAFPGGWGKLVGGVNNLVEAFVRPINVTAEYVDQISKGNIPAKITDTYNGDFNEIKKNLNNCIDVMNGLLSETDTLIKATQDGKLQTRGNAAAFAGGWGKLVGGVNNLIEAFVGPINVTAEYVDQISKGNIPAKITDTYHGDFNEIKNNLNACIDVMNSLLSETDTLIKATQDGKLQTRGNADAFPGGWGKLVGGVNNLVEAFVRPINVTAEYVDQISKGNIPAKITDTYHGDFNEIKNNLNACIDVMNSLLSETDTLIKATQDGKLQTRGNADAFPGGWGKLVGGVNNLVEAFVRPINVTAEYVDQISKGNIPAKITDTYNGDFNEIKKNLNACIDVMNGLLSETDTLIKATQDGKLQTRGNAAAFAGGWGKLVGGVNNLIEAFVRPINVTAEYVDQISKGNIPAKITDTYNGDFNEIKGNLNNCIDVMNGLLSETDTLIKATQDGKLQTRGNADAFPGGWGKLVGGVNNLVEAFVRPINVTAEYVDQISKGNIPAKITDTYNGDFNEIKKNLNACIDVMNGLLSETDTLIKATQDGKLQTRGNAAAFAGGWGKLVGGVNDLIEAFVKPINETARIMTAMASKDLTVRVTDEYKGEFGDLKNNLNKTAVALDEALTQVAVVVEQVAGASGQISAGSQTLAQGSSEQASSLEEITSTMEEMASQTKQNAGSANEAKNLAETTKASAEKGGQAMAKMSQAIDDIKQSSDKTAKIVKTIDEIAFQTNLLALNAAVEAARAGEAGKGFAVVAEEVRNLAQRSAEAAKNTASMIEESVKNADNGVQISKEVGQSLTEIREASRKVNDLVAEIAAASKEQTQGIEQVNESLGQMNSLTQSSAANAEESASASEQLSAQAEELNNMTALFHLSQTTSGGTTRAAAKQPHLNHDAGKPTGTAKRPVARKPNLEAKMPGGVANSARARVAGKVNPQEVIPMENEQELAKF